MYARFIKRILDLIFGLFLSIILIPVFIIIVAIIVIDDGFPVIYKQERVGKEGKLFGIYKFRSMVKNADKIGPTSTASGDKRITKSGRILRKTSLDELPQVWNVVKGDMSFIGYRPGVMSEETDLKAKKYRQRPGITGMAQTHGRSNITLDELHYWEDYYADNISFTLDVKIFFKTFAFVLGGKNGN